MFNFYLLIKKLKKALFSINIVIESFFNNFNKQKLLKLISIKNLKTQKIIFISTVVTILSVLTYFMIPSFYNKEDVKNLIKNQVSNQFDVNIVFNEKINYGLFPQPHFFTQNLNITNNNKSIATVKDTKILISFKNFFSIKKFKIKDFIIKEANFRFNKKDLNFFQNILIANETKYKFKINDSEFFYIDKNDEIIFLSIIDELIFFYDNKKLENKLISSYKIFNIPFKISLTNNKKEKKLYTEIDSFKIRLNLENIIDYRKNFFDGLLNIRLISKENSLNYEIDKNSLTFMNIDENFRGKMYFKPFYLMANMNFEELNFKPLIEENSVLVNLIRSEIINNQNLSMEINFNFSKIRNAKLLKNTNIKTYLQEGYILLLDSRTLWNNAVDIQLVDGQLVNSDNDIEINW